MDLLGQEEKDKNKGKKTLVLSLLIICVVLLIVLVVIILVLPQKQAGAAYFLNIDGNPVQIANDTIIADSSGVLYISLKDIAGSIGEYTYNYGEYGKYNEDRNQCYLQRANEIVGFKADSSLIYKGVSDSVIEFRNYTLKSKAINVSDKMYIDINDLQKAFNMSVGANQNGNSTTVSIYTVKGLADFYKQKITDSGKQMTISTDADNARAISYNMIVETTGGKVGVVDTNLNTVISNKYNNMKFDEYTQNFIVTIDNNKMGVVDKTGKLIINPTYDNIIVINYSPVLYMMQTQGKYGILRENGQVLVNADYDKFGYDGDSAKNRNPILIIPKINETDIGIVASQKGKYGIINLTTGKEIAPLLLDGIYSKTDKTTGETTYFVQVSRTRRHLGKLSELRKYIHPCDINPVTQI
ncbi:MAG: WG repeat-containing protein [Firmicutes bacterium]|nr:WG repeat-containing protein [Bacillota bacterium]